ncbi:sensor histidine kinase [Altericroceibacterium xinjiangense]|uniref:sensor histidine kinase n=1 Tax=Altericroceibacterium xinjiangense TaxID=762261 RepID=UPI000F7F99C0|nr:histidine kinase [Altericroceibacterium xinjiangense]
MEVSEPEVHYARVSFETVLASIAGLWLCYFVLTTLRAEILDLGFENQLLGRRALASLAGAAITLGLWVILQLFDNRPLWTKIAAALLVSAPVALAQALANQAAFADMEQAIIQRVAEQQGIRVRQTESGDLLVEVPATGVSSLAGPDAPHGTITIDRDAQRLSAWQEITEVAFGRYFMMLAWSALYLALLTGEKARAAERREGTFRRAAKAAELRSLRYQVNPHFLFNTLNSLSALVLTGRTEAAERMIQTISTFYRRSLADDPTSDVPLREEVALQRLYLEVEAVRFPDRLRVDIQLPPELADAKVPGMILQPLVENSVKHAVAVSSGQVTIAIHAREEFGQLVVTVADDGPGASGTIAPRPGHGIGLANVRDRLEARFGRQASLVSGLVPEGYVTTIRVPFDPEKA